MLHDDSLNDVFNFWTTEQVYSGGRRYIKLRIHTQYL